MAQIRDKKAKSKLKIHYYDVICGVKIRMVTLDWPRVTCKKCKAQKDKHV